MKNTTMEKEVREAYAFLRKNNQSISDDALELMLDSALRVLNHDSFPLKDLSEAFIAGNKAPRKAPDLGLALHAYLNSKTEQ